MTMHLTAHILVVNNLFKLKESEIYNLYLKDYSIMEGIMCRDGNGLIVAILDKNEVENLNREIFDIIVTVDYTEDNVKQLCKNIIFYSKCYEIM